jgi:hypothetical protein
MKTLFEQITHADGRVEYKPIKVEQAVDAPTVPEWPSESGFWVMADGDAYNSQPNLSKKQIEQFNFHPTEKLAKKASAKMRYCNAIITVCQLFDPDFEPDWCVFNQVKKTPFWDGMYEKWEISNTYRFRTAPAYFGESVNEQDVIDWLTEHYPDGAK